MFIVQSLLLESPFFFQLLLLSLVLLGLQELVFGEGRLVVLQGSPEVPFDPLLGLLDHLQYHSVLGDVFDSLHLLLVFVVDGPDFHLG